MNSLDYILAARVPNLVASMGFGPWEIWRQGLEEPGEFSKIVVLSRHTDATLMQEHGVVVMEDSMRELQKHLPIWMKASGRVLITGLGLGCVVRGLLKNPRVESIDVVEIDSHIIRILWPEFSQDPRAKIHHGDATKIKWPAGTRWDYAWHDLWMEGDGLQVAHAKMMVDLDRVVKYQGAWAFPREFKRGFSTIG